MQGTVHMGSTGMRSCAPAGAWLSLLARIFLFRRRKQVKATSPPFILLYPGGPTVKAEPEPRTGAGEHSCEAAEAKPQQAAVTLTLGSGM